MDKVRITRLLERVSRMVREDETPPDLVRAARSLDDCEDLLHVHHREMARALGRDPDPARHGPRRRAAPDEAEACLDNLRCDIGAFIGVLDLAEKIAKRGRDKGCAPELRRLRAAMERCRLRLLRNAGRRHRRI